MVFFGQAYLAFYVINDLRMHQSAKALVRERQVDRSYLLLFEIIDMGYFLIEPIFEGSCNHLH